MFAVALFAANLDTISRTWFLVPLVVAGCLVYSASRYEAPERILRRAAQLFFMAIGAFGAVLVALTLLSYGL